MIVKGRHAIFLNEYHNHKRKNNWNNSNLQLTIYLLFFFLISFQFPKKEWGGDKAPLIDPL